MAASERKQARVAVLENRIERAEARLAERRQNERRYPWARLVTFLVGAAATAAAFTSLDRPWGWIVLAAFLAAFSVVAYFHRQVLAAIRRYEILARLAREELARAALDWSGIPPAPEFPPEKNHPYEFDLNITGARSLHQLIDTAVSCGGSQRLRDWLLAETPNLEAIGERQGLVAELEPKHGLRWRLQLAGALAEGERKPGERWDAGAILSWLESQPVSRSLKALLVPLFVLAAVHLALFVLFALGRLPAWPWLISLALFWGAQGLKYRETSELFMQAYTLALRLDQLRPVLRELEEYPFQWGGRLAQAAAPFLSSEQKPSASLRQLSWIVTAASFRSNMFLGLLLNTLLPWDIFFTYLLDQYKLRLRDQLPGWLEAWYRIEALCSLANFAHLNPDNTFPRVLPLGETGEAVFQAEQMGHPLLPDSARVSNDFQIRKLGEVMIVTGSNMSGKSTFLRTMGVNLVLANAGSVVCARRLQTAAFRVYTCINLSDSLSDGISYFYAEVRRLKGLLDALRGEHELPLMFLIDEIFRGTNNRERHQGSLAYTRALAGQFGTGLISTHDLELVKLADEIPGVYNYHFREDVRGGKMVFDYRIRPGASPTTNALKIMELEGLPVEG